jgi:hypothetical protein
MRIVIALVLVACTPGAGSGPAWPKLHDAAHDGGESLAPHPRVQIAAQLEEEPPPPPPPHEVSVAPIVQPPAAPATQATPAEPDTQVIMTEEIIEVTDENPDK